MDEVLMLSAVDFCGRAYLQLDWELQQERIGEFDTFLAREFFVALANNAKMNIHIRQMQGGNAHPRHRSEHEIVGKGYARRSHHRRRRTADHQRRVVTSTRFGR
jgi:imidazoleglycerol-phosphate dehydratase